MSATNAFENEGLAGPRGQCRTRSGQAGRTVTAKYLQGPDDMVFDPLARRMVRRPEFEVLQAVVRLLAILVVDDFVGTERAAKVFCHHPAMFEDEWCRTAGHGSEERKVLVSDDGNLQDDIAGTGCSTTKAFSFHPPNVSGASSRSTATVAMAAKSLLFEKLTDGPKRIPAGLVACGASYGSTVRSPAVGSHHPIVSPDSRMWRERRLVVWSCQCCSS